MGWQWPRPDLHLNVIILMNSVLETRRIMKKKSNLIREGFKN